MDTNIYCPYCKTDMNSYKCENTCNYCDTIYCLVCKKPFHIINNISYRDHKENCYTKRLLSKL